VASSRAVLGSTFEKIINMCSLQPGETWKDWIDPYGNKLRVLKNTCRITKRNEVSKIYDIYCKADFGSISRHSYWCCFTFCGDKDWFWFIGDDGLLRLIVRHKGTWKTYPPVTSGYRLLSYIVKWYLIDEPEVLSIENLGEDFSDNATVYLTPWPPEEEIQELLEENKIA